VNREMEKISLQNNENKDDVVSLSIIPDLNIFSDKKRQ